MTRILPAFLLAACLSLAAGAQTMEFKEDAAGRVICGHARFTRLMDGMLRIEHDKEGVFDDRPTLRALTMPEPVKFDKVEFSDGSLLCKVLSLFSGKFSCPMSVTAETPLFTLRYTDDEDVTKTGLEIVWKAGGKEGVYTWGQLDYENLGGINGMDHVYEAEVGRGQVMPAGDQMTERLSELPLMYTLGAIGQWCNEHPGEYQTIDPLLWATFKDYDNLPDGLKKYCDHWLQAPPGPVSRAGYGVLDETWMYMYDKGTQWLDENVRDGYVNFFFFCYGSDYALAMKEYTTLCGRIPMLPRWAYGAWYSRYWPYADWEIKDVVKKHEEHQIPLDVVIVDMDWHINGWNGWDWNTEKFPSPEGFFKWAHETGVKIGLNVHSETAPYSDKLYEEYKKNFGNAHKDKVVSGQKDKDEFDKRYGVGTWHVQDSKDVFAVDYLNSNVWNAFAKTYYDPNDAIGVDFWWEDNWQGVMPHFNQNLWNHELMWRRHLKQGKRPMALNRYAGLGSHRYPAYFSGDTGSHWPVLNYESDVNRRAGQVGMVYFSHDLGGFIGQVFGQPFGHIDPELYVRWMQMGALCPVMRVHSNHGIREPWNYSEDVCRWVGDAYRLHHKLVPYFYHLAREAYETGLPIQRPVYFLYPENEESYSYTHSYFIGDKLFNAPVGTQGGFMNFLLPPGEYYNYFTGEEYKGGDRIRKQFLPYEIPLYVRKGSLIPNMDYSNRVGTELIDPLVMAVYPGGNDELALYEDDGLNPDYAEKNFTRLPFALKDDGRTITVTTSPVQGSFEGMKQNRNVRLDFYFVDDPASLTLDGQPLQFAKDNGKKAVCARQDGLDITKPHTWVFTRSEAK